MIKRKNKISKIITLISALAILCISLFTSFGNINMFASASSLDSAAFDTAFLFAPISSTTIGAKTYVLDQKTKTIVTISDGKVLQGEGASFSSYDAKQIYSCGKYLILVNSESENITGKIIALDPETKETKLISSGNLELTLLNEKYQNVAVYSTNNNLFMMMYTLGENDTLTEFLYLTINNTADDLEINSIQKYTMGSDWMQAYSNVTSISIIHDQTSNLTSCFAHTSTSMIGFVIPDDDSTTIQNSSSTIGSELNLDENSKVYTAYYNNKHYMFVEKQNTLYAYTISVTSSPSLSVTLDSSPSTILLDSTNITSLNINANVMSICFNDSQKVMIANLSDQNGALEITTKVEAINPNIRNVFLDVSNIEFMEVAGGVDVNLYEKPYSSLSVVVIPNGSKLTRIGYGEIFYEGESTYSRVYGYDYYMVTINGTNYYGYLDVSSTVSLITNNTSIPYAFARQGAKVYKYPSRTEDSVNTVIKTLTDVTKLELRRDISAYSYSVSGSTRSFYEVLIDDQIGYVEANDIDSVPETTRVQTNATVLRDSVIYQNKDGTVELYNAQEGKRVRIIEHRVGREKYTKITFNDDDGITCTGYILSENIKADAWSTLQIIGFVLVVFSVVLLVVILIVRNRVNHEW